MKSHYENTTICSRPSTSSCSSNGTFYCLTIDSCIGQCASCPHYYYANDQNMCEM